MEKFISSCTVSHEQSNPSIYCILTAQSKISGIALTEFLVLTPKWNTTTNIFRLPYLTIETLLQNWGMIYEV
jgi:homogentisate 1,2-dioxygenase